MSKLKLDEKQKVFIVAYATALQDLMRTATGDNKCDKIYDPMEIEDGVMHSYAFDMKDGGRHHPVSDYGSVGEITGCMLKEATDWINSDMEMKK